MATITPFLWFDGRVAEAVAFYTSVFGDSAVLDTTPYPEGSPGPPGELMMARFRLAGQELMALNGGPHYSLTPAFSLFVSCADQEEVDYYWDRLCDGGEPSRCGWLVDRFGLSWQVVPEALGRLMGDPDPERSSQVVQAMLEMSRIDVAALQAAYDGTSA
jgi:predicted 3-demethylubiquinone-9 3-methyltransferase (glyoxalase superfamily)